MKCPVCEEEMEQGFLKCSNGIYWVNAEHKESWIIKKGDVRLGYSMIGLIFNACICKSCKKVLIDYSMSNHEEK